MDWQKKDDQALRGRCDSFVVETNVHYPTDINLLLDAMRKVITLTAQWCDQRGMSAWRQHAFNLRQVKRLMRSAQNKKRARAKTAEQQEKTRPSSNKPIKPCSIAPSTTWTKPV